MQIFLIKKYVCGNNLLKNDKNVVSVCQNKGVMNTVFIVKAELTLSLMTEIKTLMSRKYFILIADGMNLMENIWRNGEKSLSLQRN